MRIEQLVFFKNVIIVSVFYNFFTGSKKNHNLRVFSQSYGIIIIYFY